MEVTRIYPTDPRVFVTLGDFYVTLKRMEDAEKQFMKAIEVDPKKISSHFT